MIQEIYDYIKNIPIIDTHEHLNPFEKERPFTDVIGGFFAQYIRTDLISAGLSWPDFWKLIGNEMTLMEKWALLKPYWESCRYTGYGQCLSLSARDIYGIDCICDDTIEALNDAYLKSYDEEHYHKILKEKCKIEVSILDIFDNVPVDQKYFIPSNRIDHLIMPRTGVHLQQLESATGIIISSFEDYLEACEIRLNQFADASPILKLGIAYQRDLNFARTSRAKAEEAFYQIIHSEYSIHKADQMYGVQPDFTNYLFHFILNLAQKKHMILQIHTGIQEGNSNMLSHSNPMHLNRIFMDYPGITFDVFHIGYPYQQELGTLCKMFPNVYVDMCWAHIVSPVAAKRTLSEWLELIPYTKILGFGGDYRIIDAVYGHQYMARRHIAEVLSEKVENGLFSIEEACRIGKAILYDNPARIYQLSL